MFDELYPNETRAVLNDRMKRPAPLTLEPPGTFTNFWGATGGALVVAPLETLRAAHAVEPFIRETLSKAGPIVGLPLEAAHRLRESFISDEEIGATLREGIERFTPDPRETGTASQIVFGAGKVLGKALGYGLVGGVPGAVIGTGLDEGINETLRLTDRGVDPETAAKVGAVHGVVTAGSIALPAAGATRLATAGYVAAGGPGAFMGEMAVARAILEAEDYADVAREYDPFDPVGLGVSTVIPAVVGVAVHAARARHAKTLPRPSTDEVAAARRVVDAEQVNSAALVARSDIEGMNAHTHALELAKRQLDAGEKVDVLDIVRADADRIAPHAAKVREALDAARLVEDPPETGHSVAAAIDDIEIPTGELDLDGNAVRVSVRQALEEAEATVRLAEEESKVFRVAVRCFLGVS